MQLLGLFNNSFKKRHIIKNVLKNCKLLDGNSFKPSSLVLKRANNLIKYGRSKTVKSNSHKNTLQNVNNTNITVGSDNSASNSRGFLSRYLESLKCNVTVWGSSVVELQVKLNDLSYLRSKKSFLRRFRSVKLPVNGSFVLPNAVQLASIRPQLTGSDLLINSPKGSGKTFLYLLPHLVHSYVFKNNEVVNGVELRNQRMVVLLPTIDLVVDESRSANGCFIRFNKRVSTLLYKDLVLNNLSHALDSEIVYSTPKSFLKLLVRFPSLASNFRFIVVDEAERMVIGEFAYLLVRIRDMLQSDAQFVFLSNFSNNYLLHQFTSRFLKLNFKIISFQNENDSKGDDNNKLSVITRHLYGPIRNIDQYEELYNSINSSNATHLNPINLKENTHVEENDNCAITLPVNNESGPETVSESGGIVSDLEKRVRRNLDLILTRNSDTDYKIDFVLYDPKMFLNSLLSELDINKKTLVYFPTVRMCQFCYVYIKHYLKLFKNISNVNGSPSEIDSQFEFFDFHSGLSLDKRRYVMDIFKLADKGILFCTNLSIGLNFNPNKIIQVSFSFNQFEVLNKFAFTNNLVNGGKDDIERVLLLNNLDGHILHEYYKNGINVTLKGCFPSSNTDSTINTEFEKDIYLINSCELMYRSLLGYYSENSKRLKIEPWTIPSFFNEFIKSFGISETFKVSPQFAARTQLLNSPGLEVSRAYNKKSSLIAALKAYPGFISKSQQCQPIF
ncbi:DEAD/DEAH box helicase family protein [Theileria parva strain Muguga]|uniref:ATP-dependent RNA helicase n=1 Tax=Theileria parva TaxID=5875 RepID=Q4N0A0_THEPA|nr:DEAD/DEAH box helicase family protein [Theileria parva strain Muguga]EAN30986.1 DEAD/DEAH box helicase family protein [Theileria parva strain Muguga]|eukprot:XP_763269.1 hypothetical protein [Theileria parva strain Muguga]